ncbi:MAG TPA: ribonuclease J [Candidatus Nitrosotalea sp.]|nr:ribonuclease J [Candidatus Nitrosotalea sp.]
MSILRYVPLGGLGEVGLNMWALEWDDQVLVIDCGLMFPTEEMPGVDLVIPDVSWLMQRRRRIVGVFLSHGHEDHIGALPFLIRRLAVPVYGTRLTLGLVRGKLAEHRVLQEADLREVAPGDRVQLGPFRVEPVAVSHSIPDAVALSIETPIGRVFYTSDFKIESDPPYGRGTDMERIREIGREGVMLLLADSTNSEREGHSGSERELAEPFEEIFKSAPGRIVVATFASNIHRLQRVVGLAARHQRRVAVAGRSMQNSFRVAGELGYLDVPPGIMVKLEAAAQEPRLVLITAGSQGEPMSALARFAGQRHNLLNVAASDWVVISARPIPGNERTVHRTINNLYRNGAERVYYSERGNVHVSGHAYRDELREMLSALHPLNFIPVHGEYRQLHHHAQLAREAGIDPSRVLIVSDGSVVEVTADGMRVTSENASGLVFVDGLGIGDVEQVVLRDRRHMAEDGVVVVTVGVDRERGGVRQGPDVVSRGLIDPQMSSELMGQISAAAVAAVRSCGKHPELTLVQQALHQSVSRLVWNKTHRRPMVVPVVSEL